MHRYQSLCILTYCPEMRWRRRYFKYENWSCKFCWNTNFVLYLRKYLIFLFVISPNIRSYSYTYILLHYLFDAIYCIRMFILPKMSIVCTCSHCTVLLHYVREENDESRNLKLVAQMTSTLKVITFVRSTKFVCTKTRELTLVHTQLFTFSYLRATMIRCS